MISYTCQGTIEEMSHQETYDIFNASKPNLFAFAITATVSDIACPG
jgi:hypothetical protein